MIQPEKKIKLQIALRETERVLLKIPVDRSRLNLQELQAYYQWLVEYSNSQLSHVNALLKGCNIFPVIVPATSGLRTGWDKAFTVMAERHDDRLLDNHTVTDWDRDEWEW